MILGPLKAGLKLGRSGTRVSPLPDWLDSGRRDPSPGARHRDPTPTPPHLGKWQPSLQRRCPGSWPTYSSPGIAVLGSCARLRPPAKRCSWHCFRQAKSNRRRTDSDSALLLALRQAKQGCTSSLEALLHRKPPRPEVLPSVLLSALPLPDSPRHRNKSVAE